ncbi:unnamed protein product [Larinioides sclopetarius]|uniref:Uncharacterized protein n=1 Tax=Larinioides sclopetarius TaxID=280406 RepID=A0AAV2B3K9_9ARAC
MFFLVCFQCAMVYTYEEGHPCPCSEGSEDERNSENVIMIRAEPTNLRKDSPASSTKANTRKADNVNMQRSRSRKRSTRSGFLFSVVSSECGRITDMECQTSNGFVCGISEAPRTEIVDIFFPIESEPKNAAAEFYTQPAFPENVPHYSRQSTQHESNKNDSIQGTHTLDYPAVNMECQTINNNFCGSNKSPRKKRGDNFHPRGPEPRYVAAESCMPLTIPENIAHYLHQCNLHQFRVPHYSRQPTQHESNKNASIQGTHTVDYPAVNMERQTINKDFCGIDEAARNKNVDNFHPQGLEPRNVAVESCLPLAFPENMAHHLHQSIQHESNKNTFIQGTHPVDFPAVSHQSNHSSRQHTKESGGRNTSAQEKQLIKSSLLTSMKKNFTCEKSVELDSRRNSLLTFTC